MEEKSLKQKIDELWDERKEGKEKKFKLPFSLTSQAGKTRKNYAIIQILRTNGAIDFKMLPIHDNTVKIGETYHEATARYMMRYKKFPWLIIPEWNISPIKGSEELEVKPFDPGKNLEDAIKKGNLSAAEKFILQAIQMDATKPKMKMNVLTIILILAAIGGLLWILSEVGVLS